MDSKLKADWIAALRSGEYEQWDGALRNSKGTKHCCLGVLCEVSGLEISDDGYAIIDKGQPSNSYKPLETRLGIAASVIDAAYKKNDSGQSFPQIADWLESNPDV